MRQQKKKKKNGYGFLPIFIILLTLILAIAVLFSVGAIGFDIARKNSPRGDSERQSSGAFVSAESSEKLSADSSSDVASCITSESSSGSASEKGSEDVTSEGEKTSSNVSPDTSGKASGKTSGKASDKTSDKTSEKTSDNKQSGTGKEYIPFKPTEKLIAITFDDGPYDKVTNIILDKLEGTNDHVTFFVVGDRVPGYASTVKRAVELGCEIGGHSYHHSYLTDLSESELREELRKTDEAVFNASGAKVSILRPPGGYYDKQKDYGYALIMWAIDTEDWKQNSYVKKGSKSKEEAIDAVYNEIINNAYSGSTVLLHDLYETSALAFCRAYDTLKSQGYRFVTVSEMLQIEGRTLKPYVFFGTNQVYLYGKRVEV